MATTDDRSDDDTGFMRPTAAPPRVWVDHELVPISALEHWSY
jgi:hypothetical protein